MSRKSHNYASIVAALVALASGSAVAGKGEKCKIVYNGKGLIKAHKADCSGKTGKNEKNSCAGQNDAGDPNAWIFLPKGSCTKIEGGEVLKDDDKKKNEEVKKEESKKK